MYLAILDRRTPWYAKALGGCVVAYALSPIDLIPDPIPVIGYLDDLIVVPIVPSSLSFTALAQLQGYAQNRDRPSPALLPVFSMVDRRRRAHREAIEAAPKQNAIPYASAMERMTAAGLPIAEIAPGSPAAKSLAALWRTVQKKLAPDAALSQAA